MQCSGAGSLSRRFVPEAASSRLARVETKEKSLEIAPPQMTDTASHPGFDAVSIFWPYAQMDFLSTDAVAHARRDRRFAAVLAEALALLVECLDISVKIAGARKPFLPSIIRWK